MNNDQRVILDELTALSGQIVYWGAVKVKILSPPTVRGQRIFLSMEGIPSGAHYDIDKPLEDIQGLRNRLTLEIPRVNADIETEIRRRAPDPNQKGPTIASVWRTRHIPVFLVFSRELSDSDIVRKSRFKIARDKSDTAIIYLLIDNNGDKPSQKTKGRLGIVIKETVAEWFNHKDYEVDVCKTGIHEALRLIGK